MVLPNNYNNNVSITNIIIMKKSEILQELPKCDTEIGSKQMLLEKNGPDRFAIGRVATSLQFLQKSNVYEVQ